MNARFLLLGLAVIAASVSPLQAADPPEAPKADATYQNALVAAIHRFAKNRSDAEYLAALLERNPKLVNERIAYEPQRTPLLTYSRTALHEAAIHGNAEGVRTLLAYKADVSMPADLGWTPLHFAARYGHLDVCKALVAAGAKIDAKTAAVPEVVLRPGENALMLPAIPALTPLDLAKDGKHKDVVEYLSGLSK